MVNISSEKKEWILKQIEKFSDRPYKTQPKVFDDTSHYMSIERDHLIELNEKLYLIRTNELEGRFGIDDQPKFWVKRAISLHNGKKYIIKLVFHEDFKIHIGFLQIRCSRSPDKEGDVLDLVRGDDRFMQGQGGLDKKGNLVRIIDFIKGSHLLKYVSDIPVGHEEYFNNYFPKIFGNLMDCIRGIKFLHDNKLCHGDIRNDHIYIDQVSGRYKWIDFDLKQDFTDFDVWSIGNILNYIAGKGFTTFKEIHKGKPDKFENLLENDASVFFPHRVMNLGKVFPYIPDSYQDILKKFSLEADVNYSNIDQILTDLEDCAESLNWPMSYNQ